VTPVQFTIRVPSPWLLTSNRVAHWSKKAQCTRYIRHLAGFETRFSHPGVKLPAAHLTVCVTWPDRRRRDVHNVMPTIKAAIDGVVDAGLLPDDSDQYLTGPDLRVSGATGSAGHVEFTFVFTPREAS
jgi:crossover junction endodeoxyribonuclease RusA